MLATATSRHTPRPLPDRPTVGGAPSLDRCCLTPAALHGLTLGNVTPAQLARAAVEGVLCGLADALDALVTSGIEARSVRLIGGVAQSEAVRRVTPTVLGCPVDVPEPGEYVARGAARQAAWVLAGTDEPPDWPSAGTARYEADAVPAVRERYRRAQELTLTRL